MKTFPFKFLVFCTAALAAFATTVRCAPQAGKPAPDFTLTDLGGQKHSLSDYKGKTVVLEWVNPDCPFVRNHYQNTGSMPKLQAAAKADGVIWLTINSGHPGSEGDYSPEKVAAWMKETGAAPTAYFRDQDGAVGKLYDAKATPHMFVISADGTLVYHGAIDSIPSTKPEDVAKATNYVAAALHALKAGKPVAVSATRAYGCSVKY
jgi:hypothetical protein